MRFALFSIHLRNDIAALSNGLSRRYAIGTSALRTKEYTIKDAVAAAVVAAFATARLPPRETLALTCSLAQFSYFICEIASAPSNRRNGASANATEEYRRPTRALNKKRSLNELETGTRASRWRNLRQFPRWLAGNARCLRAALRCRVKEGTQKKRGEKRKTGFELST